MHTHADLFSLGPILHFLFPCFDGQDSFCQPLKAALGIFLFPSSWQQESNDQTLPEVIEMLKPGCLEMGMGQNFN